MERLKVLNKAYIQQLLDEGCILCHNNVDNKVYMMTKDLTKLGIVRYETYLKFSGSVKLFSSISFYDYYKKENLRIS